MLKIRLQGTTNDIKWFMKILSRDKRFVINAPSEPQNIKGTRKYKRVYTEIFRDREEHTRHQNVSNKIIAGKYYGTGTTFGYTNPSDNK
ncbi:MAG: hypothetical protein IJ141_02665 [Lachnospiraceae bacterium]|nr:hypothetical protein [Lachnospiraceae bacterium]